MINHFDYNDRTIDRMPNYKRGQPHTDYGKRGSYTIQGVKFSDLYQAVSLAIKDSCTETEFISLNIDPEAVAQNLRCEVEKLMGIYPNLPKSQREQTSSSELDEILFQEDDYHGIPF